MSTMRKVAEKAGVSISTVSHVINNTRAVSTEARDRVLAAARELNYQPNELARSLRLGQSFTIGLLLIDNVNPFFAKFARHVEAVLSELGYNVILCNTGGDPEKEALYVDVLLKRQVDGIIFYAARSAISAVSQYLRSRVPIVVVERNLADTDLYAPNLLTDNFHGGYIATQHLIKLGHTQIAFIAGPENVYPAAERARGFRQALTDAELPVQENLLRGGDFHEQSGYDAADILLSLSEPPTAIFACNDLTAFGAIRAAQDRGVRVPQDLSIVGYDDITMCLFVNPRLTTIAQPINQMAQAAVDMLIEQIVEDEPRVQSETLATELVVRDSTCARQ